MNTDDEGWTYDTDFGTFKNGTGKKGMVHFVRRRRLIRFQDFDIKRITGTEFKGTCSYCDLAQIELLKSKIVTAVATASLYSSSSRAHISTVNALKSEIINTLGISSKGDPIGMV